MAPRLPVALLLLVLCGHVPHVRSHGDTGSTGEPCLRNVGVKLQAAFVPGIITVDGLPGDWSSMPGNSFQLNPALTDDGANAYPGGSMEIKVRFMFLIFYVQHCLKMRILCSLRIGFFLCCARRGCEFICRIFQMRRGFLMLLSLLLVELVE
jgi:hypothetical protein